MQNAEIIEAQAIIVASEATQTVASMVNEQTISAEADLENARAVYEGLGDTATQAQIDEAQSIIDAAENQLIISQMNIK